MSQRQSNDAFRTGITKARSITPAVGTIKERIIARIRIVRRRETTLSVLNRAGNPHSVVPQTSRPLHSNIIEDPRA
jgi:hypothetical protein